ncbi:phosphotransferase family protein [Metasolibacillus meyeri]|uniref:phosphotransferase family protein n=1 Tax=Metasolibacillus meyeri TaxID=1071052 RepID=UPI000D3076F7|nr:phosphotransferase [Metasolibacillus meyeri]
MQPIKEEEIPNEIQDYLKNIHAMRFPKQGYTSNVAIIENDHRSYVLKRAKGELFSSWLNKEVAVINRLTSETKLPIPKVAFSIEQKSKNEAWALIEFLPGETIRSALSNEKNMEKRQEILFNFGQILHQIHATPCPNELMAQQPWLPKMLEQAQYNLENYEVDGTKELLEKIQVNKPSSIKQTLIHGDFTVDNVLVENGVITGVIDWSGGIFGDPRYDLSLAIRPKPNIFENDIDKQIFFEGYGEKIIDNDLYNYFANGLYEFF